MTSFFDILSLDFNKDHIEVLDDIFIYITKDYKKIDNIVYTSFFLISKQYLKTYLNNYYNYQYVEYYVCLDQFNNQKIYTKKTINLKSDSEILITTVCLGALTSIKVIHDELSYLQKLNEIKITKNKPKLLIHSCCGPCSSQVLMELTNYFNITILFYNPNIYPLEEFNKRYLTLASFIDKANLNIKVIKDSYSYFDYEVDNKCYNCYKIRLDRTNRIATSMNFDYFTTTLSISPHKNSNWINEIGSNYPLFMYSNFKLNEGYKKSIELSKQYDLYRQSYCGCLESLKNLKEKNGN